MAVLEPLVPGTDNGANYYVDESVLKGVLSDLIFLKTNLTSVEFPKDSKVVEAKRYSTAAWTTAIRVIIQLRNGKNQSYFLKVRTRTTILIYIC